MKTVCERSNLINLISKMAEFVYNNKASFLELKNYRIFFFNPRRMSSNKKIFIYSIGDSTSDEKIVGLLLRKLIRKMEPLLSTDEFFQKGILSKATMKKLTNMVHKCLADEILNSRDRLTNYILS